MKKPQLEFLLSDAVFGLLAVQPQIVLTQQTTTVDVAGDAAQHP